jgi:hypothetical protein
MLKFYAVDDFVRINSFSVYVGPVNIRCIRVKSNERKHVKSKKLQHEVLHSDSIPTSFVIHHFHCAHNTIRKIFFFFFFFFLVGFLPAWFLPRMPPITVRGKPTQSQMSRMMMIVVAGSACVEPMYLFNFDLFCKLFNVDMRR